MEPPLARCSRCGRGTADPAAIGLRCRAPQPDGGRCGGWLLIPAATPPDTVAPDALVTVAEAGRHGSRWHADPACWAIRQPKRARLEPRALAERLGRHECPVCCPLPACCAADTHGGTVVVLPAPLAPTETPEWEAELLADLAPADLAPPE